MNLNWPWLLRYKGKITPSLRIGMLAWALLAVGAYSLFSTYDSKPTTPLVDTDNHGRSPADSRPVEESGNPELQPERERMNQKPGSETQSGVSDRGNLTQSKQAILKANMAKHTALVNTAMRDLGKLKNLQMEWAALDVAVMNGAAGTRIAASPKHFPLIVDLWQNERPTAEQIVDWESELNPLTEPITQAAAASTTISISDEHAKRLSDLGQELKTQAAEFERQKLLLESIQRETSALPPGSTTLAAALEQHCSQTEQAKAERLAAAGAAARAAVEKELAEKIAKAEQELAKEEARQELQKIASEQQLQAEKASLAQLQQTAKMEALKEEAKRTQDAVQEALLDSQMQRDMNEIKGLLAAFVSPGFKHRNDDRKGPASLSVIKGRKALEGTQTGMTALLWLACADNDRPHDALPYYIGGYVNWNETNARPIERAQELLNKYGELMVKKGLLAE